MSDYESNDVEGAARLAARLEPPEGHGRPGAAEYIDDPRTEREHLRLFNGERDD